MATLKRFLVLQYNVEYMFSVVVKTQNHKIDNTRKYVIYVMDPTHSAIKMIGILLMTHKVLYHKTMTTNYEVTKTELSP